MSPGMYCKIHLLEIMRLSAFKSALFYPSSQTVPNQPTVLIPRLIEHKNRPTLFCCRQKGFESPFSRHLSKQKWLSFSILSQSFFSLCGLQKIETLPNQESNGMRKKKFVTTTAKSVVILFHVLCWNFQTIYALLILIQKL